MKIVHVVVAGEIGGAERMLVVSDLSSRSNADRCARALALALVRLPAAIEAAAEAYAPHKLCAYLYDTAAAFTTFYERCPVLKASPAVRGNRWALCALTGETLRTGLDLLNLRISSMAPGRRDRSAASWRR